MSLLQINHFPTLSVVLFKTYFQTRANTHTHTHTHTHSEKVRRRL